MFVVSSHTSTAAQLRVSFRKKTKYSCIKTHALWTPWFSMPVTAKTACISDTSIISNCHRKKSVLGLILVWCLQYSWSQQTANMIYITFSIQISVRVSPPQITGGGFHRFSISTTSDINTELSRPAENILHIWILMILQFLKVRGCCCFNISSLF